MLVELARIITVLTAFERHYGLSGLDPVERSIFFLVVQNLSAGRGTTTDEILEQRFSSRATVYRRIASLEQSGLIRATSDCGVKILVPDARFQKLPGRIGKMFQTISKAP